MTWGLFIQRVIVNNAMAILSLKIVESLKNGVAAVTPSFSMIEISTVIAALMPH